MTQSIMGAAMAAVGTATSAWTAAFAVIVEATGGSGRKGICPRLRRGAVTVERMAGTMTFELAVTHVYQRTFDTEELRKTLSSSHWYIISRCARVRIVEGSVRIDDDIVSLKVSVQHGPDELVIEPLVLDVRPAGSVSAFETHREGSYFTMVIDEKVMHGDAWSLASLFTRARADIARQEVLYIGQSFADGQRDASGRTTQHKTLQRIYEDHVGIAQDIFVAPLHLESRAWSGDDHIEDDEDGPDPRQFFAEFAEPGGPIKRRAVDLIEHAMIAYFDPPYNQKLRHWDSKSPTLAMRAMRKAGFRLLAVHVNNWAGLARFYSSLVTDPIRSHLILHDVPPEPVRPQLRGIAADNVSSWRPGGAMVRYGPGLFAGLGEYAGVELKVFGDQAPADRRPPGVPLPDAPATGKRVSPKLPRTREVDRTIAKKRRRLQELRKLQEPPARPTYRDGMIELGTLTGGDAARWTLHDSGSQTVEHGFVLGEEDVERAALLCGVAREAFRSRRFNIVLCGVELDVSAWSSRWWDLRPHPAVVIGKNGHQALADACEIIDQRARRGIWSRELPSRRKPGMLIAIANTDEIVADASSTELLSRVLESGARHGIALALGIKNVDAVVSVAGGALLDFRNQYSMAVGGFAQVGSVRTSLRPQRQVTAGESGAVTFLLTGQRAVYTVSELVEVFAPEFSFEEIQPLATARVMGDEISDEMGWGRVGRAEMWTMLDPIAARFWHLRKHADAWALTRVAGRSNRPSMSDRAERIAWAESMLQSRFRMPSVASRWQVGPTFAGADSETLYCSLPKSVVDSVERSTEVWRAGPS